MIACGPPAGAAAGGQGRSRAAVARHAGGPSGPPSYLRGSMLANAEANSKAPALLVMPPSNGDNGDNHARGEASQKEGLTARTALLADVLCRSRLVEVPHLRDFVDDLPQVDNPLSELEAYREIEVRGPGRVAPSLRDSEGGHVGPRAGVGFL